MVTAVWLMVVTRHKSLSSGGKCRARARLPIAILLTAARSLSARSWLSVHWSGLGDGS